MHAHAPLRSILLTTALGEPSRKAAPLACMLASSQCARVHVLHVVPAGLAVVASPGGMADAGPAPLADQVLHDAWRRLKAFVQQELAWRCCRVSSEVRVGTPIYGQIVDYAREHSIDLIIAGTHGDGMLHRAVFGSVTKAVVEHAPCPVMLVPCARARAQVQEPAEADMQLAFA